MGLKEIVRRLFGRKESAGAATIAALEEEFAGIEPTKLARYDYRHEEEKPAFRISRSVVEVLRVQGFAKPKGETVKGTLTVAPTASREKFVFDLINAQQQDEIEPGKTLRFTFPEIAQQKIFVETGDATLYVKGAGDQKWVFKFIIPWDVPVHLRA